MKTPIEELIKWLDMSMENCKQFNKPQLVESFRVTKKQAENLLEKEKQAIIDAHCSGELCKKEIGTLTTRSNEYYNQKYNK